MPFRKNQQSVIDTLLNILPSTDFGKKRMLNGSIVSRKAADKLFYLWKQQDSPLSNGIYHKPSTMSLEEVKGMQKEGLIRDFGDRIEFTKKGNEVIKIMILGDDKSSFEDDGKQINYEVALANTKAPTRKQAKKRRETKGLRGLQGKIEQDWWSRFGG